jgi:hypothetical protein
MVGNKSMRNRAMAPRCITLIVLATFGLVLIAPAIGQDRMVLGPNQFKEDTSGAGAVLCVWSIYLSVQAQTAACALPRRPVDDAIDQAIVAIDEFILANSSLHPTRPMLEKFKHDAAEGELSSARRWRGPQFCKNEDLEGFRSPSPEKIQASVKALLAIPREPVMNPCL